MGFLKRWIATTWPSRIDDPDLGTLEWKGGRWVVEKGRVPVAVVFRADRGSGPSPEARRGALDALRSLPLFEARARDYLLKNRDTYVPPGPSAILALSAVLIEPDGEVSFEFAVEGYPFDALDVQFANGVPIRMEFH